MSVSATEVARAAVEFWRQGLGEGETEKRLKASIQYAKISAMEFDEAAELITAATNTMEVSAQHVADIFVWAMHALPSILTAILSTIRRRSPKCSVLL